MPNISVHAMTVTKTITIGFDEFCISIVIVIVIVIIFVVLTLPLNLQHLACWARGTAWHKSGMGGNPKFGVSFVNHSIVLYYFTLYYFVLLFGLQC